MTHSLSAAGDRHQLRIERRYPHPVEKVWRAITDPEELSGWFPATVYTELTVGAIMTFAFPDQPPMANGKITELDPPRLFAFDWGGELMHWELHAQGPESTLLVFTHTFDDRGRAASFAAGWDSCFDALDQVLAGAAVTAPEGYPDRHESYVEQFGLGEGRLDGGHVTFDRAYPWPLDAVADAMRALEPPDHKATWQAEEIPGGSRIRLVVHNPDEPDKALHEWGSVLAQVAQEARRSKRIV